MNTFHPSQDSPLVIAQAGPQRVLRIGEDGVFVRTGDARIEISENGLLVEHGPPHPPTPPHPGGERLAVFPLLVIAVLAVTMLLLLNRRARKGAAMLLMILLLVFGLTYTMVRQEVLPPPVVTSVPSSAEWQADRAMQAILPMTMIEPAVPAPAAAVSMGGVSGEASPAAEAPGSGTFTLYPGASTTGVTLSAPPPWISDTSGSASGQTFTSGRFATVDQAERQLWNDVQRSARELLVQRYPEARNWNPPRELLQQVGIIVERCVEKTQLSVGGFTEPMFIVHWRVAMNDNVRDQLARAWGPVASRDRVIVVGAAVGVATGLLALLNLMLRGISASFWQRVMGRKVAATGVAVGLLVAGLGLLMG